jgi:hypothetical protein
VQKHYPPVTRSADFYFLFIHIDFGCFEAWQGARFAAGDGNDSPEVSVERNERQPFVEVIDELIAQATNNLYRKNLKATVADLLRATELEREMFPPLERPIEITWIDPWD